MVFEPGIEVNPVVHATPSKVNTRHVQLRQERDANTEIGSGLFFGQTAGRRQGQAGFFHGQPRDWRSYSLRW